jgi:NET1-associated nuclear protein 1 (U3 small nucleolar RNA-associated protein 17)
LLHSYLVSAYGNDVSIFSLATSQVYTSFSIGKLGRISGLHIFGTDPLSLYVFTTTGSLSLWNWKSSKQLRTWKAIGDVHHFEFYETRYTGGVRKGIAFLRQKKDGRSQISTSMLDEGDSSHQLQDTVILDTSMPVTELKVSPSGMAIIALGGHHLLVGRAAGSQTLSGVCEYDWREIVLPFETTALDIREHLNLPPQSGNGSAAGKSGAVDLALINNEGSILVFCDIANTPWEASDAHQARFTDLLVSQRLHWHREGADSLRWSKDGTHPFV